MSDQDLKSKRALQNSDGLGHNLELDLTRTRTLAYTIAALLSQL